MAKLLDSVKPKAIAAVNVLASPLMLQASHVQHEDLTPSEIEASWVVEGAPRARVKHLAQAPDGELAVALWDCTAGKFNWYFGGDEFVHILVGEVTVTDGDGQTRTLRPGDIAYFPAGMRSLWHVHGYVKKLAIFRQNRPSLIFRARRKLSSILRSAPAAAANGA
jgi:uncharacterized cupin superfamily protein